MLIDSRNLAAHRAWILATALATLAASLWYALASMAARSLVGGGSVPGLVFGIVGGLICVFEILLWPRKKLRPLRLGRLQTWMKAHLWLGLLSLPILVLHSGFRWGGTLSAATMALFLAVIASGVWGLVLQNVLPRKMLAELPAETIYSQIPRIVAQYRDEARKLVAATCGPRRAEDAAAPEPEDEPAGVSTHYLVVGAMRSAGRIRGKVAQTRVVPQAVDGAEPLRAFHEQLADPFLTEAGFGASPLRRVERADALFDDLNRKLSPAARESAAALRGLCDQRRQLAEQARLHVWLHNWLAVHLPLSIALIVLMFVHIYQALRYL